MLPRPTLMALDLTVWQMLGVSLIVMLALLLLAYGIAGWHERRARSRREKPKAEATGPQAFDIPTAIGLSILTIGVYFWVLVYRNSREIQEMAENGFHKWRWLFWGAALAVPLAVLVLILGVWVGLGLFERLDAALGIGRALFYLVLAAGAMAEIGLYVFNWAKFRDWAQQRGVHDDSILIVALVLGLLLPYVGAVVWAYTWNHTLETVDGYMPTVHGSAAPT